MKDSFAPYDVSKMLKEIGFNESCMAWYDNSSNKISIELNNNTNIGNYEKFWQILGNSYQRVSAPLWQQIEQWLWEKHAIWMEIERIKGGIFRVIVYYSNSKDGFIFDEEYDFINVRMLGLYFLTLRTRLRPAMGR